MATADDFFAIDMRVGTVLTAEHFPEARKPSITPFPPPPGKFPPPNAPFPPPAAAAEAGKAKKVRKPATKKQKLITFGAVGFIVLLALGWAVSRVLSANAAPPVVEHKPVPKKAPVKPAATAEKPAENPAEKPAEATPATAVAETPAPAGT